MEKDIILATIASYQNRDGILTLSPRKLQWSVQGEKSPTIDTAISEIKNFFVGKQNAAEAKFRIKCVDYNNQEVTHTIILKSQSPWDDLEIIKAKVKNKGQGRSAAPSPAPQGSAATSPIHYKSAAPSPASGGSSPAVWNNNLQQNKNGTTTNGRNGTRKMPTAKEINLRKNLLMRDKKLADQHRILVVEQKCIAEEEFWELRKNLLRDQDTRTSQQKGRSSTMPSLRPVTEEGGEAKINITPQLVNEIFEEYPRVKIAFEKNVPNKISEEVFWKRYVHSKFNDRNRGTTSVVNDDIFDKCWTETEDDLNQEREHGRKRLKISNLRDLSATREDHIEIDFTPDITMRAGQGKILSLLRRNNRHGERILETACEKSRRYKEMTAQQEKKEVYKEDILMEDLIEEELPSTYKLDIMDQREYFASQTTEIDNDAEMIDNEQNSIKHQNSIELLNKFRESFKSWNPNLTKSLFPKHKTPIPNLVTEACNGMIEDKQNRVRASKPKIENLPQKIEKEVNIIQLMGNEFLRHFWVSVDSTVKEKAEKNKRMIEQLKSILIKIEQISELKPPDDDNKQTLNLPNGTQKGQRLDKEQRAIAVNGKRSKISSRTSGSSFEQANGNSSGSSRIESEWKDALIQAQQLLDPLSKAVNKALTHMNISRPNNRQGPTTSQTLQKSSIRTSSPDHHRAVSRDSRTTSPDHHKSVPRDTKSASPDIQKPIPRDIKQAQHHGTQRIVNREARQVTNLKIQKSGNHDMQHDTQQISIPEVQRSNRQISANMRQDTSRINTKVSSVRNTTQFQAARPEANRETVPNRTTTKKITKQNVSRDDLQSNGRDTHHATPKSSNVAPPGSSTQVSSVNRIKSSTKRKR